MKNALKIFACVAACFSTVLAQPALANNRGFSALAAVPENPGAGCFSHAFGNPNLKNTCDSTQSVFLPMSVDDAGWYTLSVYGRGLIDANGRRSNIWCTANAVFSSGNTTMSGQAWQAFPENGAFGGVQAINLGQIPIYSAGDAAYAYCQLAPSTQLFTYGWN